MAYESIELSGQEAIFKNQFDQETNTLSQVKQKNQESAKDTAEAAVPVVKAAQNSWRIFNLVCALSLYALIVTVITMHLQLILGNYFKIRRIPSLHWIEIAILIILDFIIFMFILIAAGVFAALVAQLKWLGKLAPILETVK